MGYELVEPDKSHTTQNQCVINFISHASGDMTFIRCVTCANAVLSLDRNTSLYDKAYNIYSLACKNDHPCITFLWLVFWYGVTHPNYGLIYIHVKQLLCHSLRTFPVRSKDMMSPRLLNGRVFELYSAETGLIIQR